MNSKMMKIIEIGDGFKSISIPENFVSDWENDDTVIIYNPSDCDINIRVSVLTIEGNKNNDLIAYNKIKEKAKQEGRDIFLVDDKCYFVNADNCKDDNYKIIYFQIGFKNHIIIISITVESIIMLKGEEQKYFDIVKSMISTLDEISINENTTHYFELKLEDVKLIQKRVSEILCISSDKIDVTHKFNKTINTLQKLLDSSNLSENESYELQSMGLAFGDYFKYKNPDFDWIIVRDELGRDYALRYKNSNIVIFPMTMISKRIEDGDKVIITELFEHLKNTIDNVKNDFL